MNLFRSEPTPASFKVLPTSLSPAETARVERRFQRRMATSRCAVYLLMRHDRCRFKIGLAEDPLARAAMLPEGRLGLIDLAASRVLWQPDARRARQVEAALHKALAMFNVLPDHEGDGYTEWFSPLAVGPAVRLITHLHQLDGGDAQLVPLSGLEPGAASSTSPPTAGLCPPPGSGQAVLDAWWRLEDLWWRLSNWVGLRSRCSPEGDELIAVGLRPLRTQGLDLLRAHLLDLDTYRWEGVNEQGDLERGELVQLLRYEGDDLVLTLAAHRRVTRWPQGDVLVWQMGAFVARVRSMKAPTSLPSSPASPAEPPAPRHGLSRSRAEREATHRSGARRPALFSPWSRA